jgi:hypothetical protein
MSQLMVCPARYFELRNDQFKYALFLFLGCRSTWIALFQVGGGSRMVCHSSLEEGSGIMDWPNGNFFYLAHEIGARLNLLLVSMLRSISICYSSSQRFRCSQKPIPGRVCFALDLVPQRFGWVTLDAFYAQLSADCPLISSMAFVFRLIEHSLHIIPSFQLIS